MAKKKYYHIDLPPDVQAFKDRLLKATQWEKTTGCVTFYKMYDQHYVRSKSSLTGKRVKRSKQFARTMHNAGILAKASKIITPLYYRLTEDWRCQDVFRKLTGIAVKLLHEGKSKEEVEEGVNAALRDMGYRTAWTTTELPPNLQQWLEEENAELSMPENNTGLRQTKTKRQKKNRNTRQRMIVVNANGQLVAEYLRRTDPAHMKNASVRRQSFFLVVGERRLSTGLNLTPT